MDNHTTKPTAAEPNIIDTALKAGRDLAPKLIANPLKDGLPFVVLRDPDGTEIIEYLDPTKHTLPPQRIERSMKVGELPSLLEYWETYANEGSRIYANKERITGIIDEHTKDTPAYTNHRVLLEFTHSPEWQTWIGANKRPFQGTQALAEFIENNIFDFVQPEGARMLEIAANFSVTQNASYGKAMRMQDGNIRLHYTNDVNAVSSAGEQTIPDQFKICIPVHAGLSATAYTIDARFRYRLKTGTSELSLWYELIRPEKVLEKALSDIIFAIEEQTGKAVIMGA